jgi:hypothetical protein
LPAHSEPEKEQQMTVHDLAEAFRARSDAYLDRNPDKFSPAERTAIQRQNKKSTDEEIIEAYVTCNSCGEKCLGGSALAAAISAATTAEQFLRAVPHSCHQN